MPLFVNLIAFDSKLIIICLILVESPEKNAGKFSSMFVWSLTFDFCWNSGDVTNNDECITSCKFTDSMASLTFPASIYEEICEWNKTRMKNQSGAPDICLFKEILFKYTKDIFKIIVAVFSLMSRDYFWRVS